MTNLIMFSPIIFYLTECNGKHHFLLCLDSTYGWDKPIDCGSRYSCSSFSVYD